MLVMTMSALSIRKIHVSEMSECSRLKIHGLTILAGIKEVVTLTSDLSRKNLEKDFERMDTPQGTFYRKSRTLQYLPIAD